MAKEPTDPFAGHIKPPGSGLPPLRPTAETAPEPEPEPQHRSTVMQGLLALSLVLNLVALGLIALLITQPSTLGLADDTEVTALEKQVATLQKQVEAVPKRAEVRQEVRAVVAQIRRGPRGERGPRGAVGSAGPPGTVEGYDLDDFDSRLSYLEGVDAETRVIDLEAFRDDLCSAFSTSDVEPISDLYYFGPC